MRPGTRAPQGTLIFELGDTYSGAGGYGAPDSVNPAYSAERFAERWDSRPAKRFKRKDDGWPLDKSLCGIPQLFMLSLAYGRNMLRPERRTPRWRVRNVVVWCRPNPPVGALGDKVRPATSYLTVACKARDRYFDLDAVRDGTKQPNVIPRAGRKEIANPDRGTNSNGTGDNPAGAPPLDYWVIPTQPYSESHYATYPERLCEIPVKSMCPLKVCLVCGQPSRRIVDVQRPGEERMTPYPNQGHRSAQRSRPPTRNRLGDDTPDGRLVGLRPRPRGGPAQSSTQVRPRSGTTLAVATGHGRDAIGIDIDQRNADLALQRVGPLLLEVLA